MERPLDREIEAARLRVDELLERAQKAADPEEELSLALAELSGMLEELHATAEELIATREQVEEERQRYLDLFESAPDGYLETDPAGIILEANRAAAVMLGLDPAVLRRKPLAVFVPLECRAPFRRTMADIVGEKNPVTWETPLEPRRRRPMHVMVTASPVRDASGAVTHLRWMLRDITVRKHTEDELRVLNRVIGISASSQSLSALLEASVAGIMEMLDFDLGMVYLLNDAQTYAVLQHLVGVSDAYIARNRTIPVHQWPFHFIFAAGEARVIESGEALAPADKQILSELAIASLACVPLSTEGAVIGALCFGRKVGNVLYEFERPLLVAIGEILGAAVRRHLLHQHLKDAHREANLYLDIMTHDMRNAENVSGLYAEMLVDMLEGEAKQRAQKLQGSIQRSINTIKNVTTLRRIYRESPELKPVDLDGVIREEIGTATGSSVRYEGAKVLVLADELLPEIFSNLIGNAVKFGGQDVEIAICVERTDGDVRVLVEDTGRGIPDEMKVVLTRRFERGEGRERGEGLGLYIVRTLIRRYGGSVRVADRVPGHPEEGAAFRLAFRKADAEEIERSGPESAVAGMHEHP